MRLSKGETDRIFQLVSQDLSGTPYVVSKDPIECGRYGKARTICRDAQEIASRAQERIRRQAGVYFGQFSMVVRGDLVAESNRIEGYEWSKDAVIEVVSLKRELLSLPIRTFTEAVRADARLYEALGLYKAHALAEEWAESGVIPNESEIRAIHSLIAVGAPYAGRYKLAENRIEGSSLKPSIPLDVSRHMRELVSWWQTSSDREPVLVATVIHAWITQIHPFDDGNGRLARLLANMALAQRKYPPLIVRSESDRGQYLDALAHCDDGDILPLYELFSRIARRQVGQMGSHDYVRRVINGRLFEDVKLKHEIWRALAESFVAQLQTSFLSNGWAVMIDGYPDVGSFQLLEKGLSEGGSWLARVGPQNDRAAILLWWGFESPQMRVAAGDRSKLYPSIFVSTRFGTHKHPYRRESVLSLEIQLRPMLASRSVIISSKNDVEHFALAVGVSTLVNDIAHIYESSRSRGSIA